MRHWTIYLYKNGDRSMALSPIPDTEGVDVVALSDVVDALRTKAEFSSDSREAFGFQEAADFIEAEAARGDEQ